MTATEELPFIDGRVSTRMREPQGLWVQRMIRSLVSGTLLSALLLLRTAIAFDSAPWQPSGESVTIPIAPNGSALGVAVKIKGRTYEFIVDTGSRWTILDRRLIEHLDRPEDAAARRLTVPMPIYVYDFSSPIDVAGYSVRDIGKVAVLDLERLSIPGRARWDGIIGMDVLQRFFLHLDFDSKRLVICDSNVSQKPPGVPIRITMDAVSRPLVRGLCGKRHHAEFLLDTGYIGIGTISNDLIEELAADKCIRKSGTRMERLTSDGTSAIATHWLLPEFAFAGKWQSNVGFFSAANNAVGLYSLYRYKVSLDFQRNMAYFEPSSLADARDRGDGDGIVFRPDNLSRQTVIYVFPRSIGEHAGFKVGDVVFEIDGKKSEDLTDKQLDTILSTPNGKAIHMKAWRGGKEISLLIPEG